MKVSLSIASSFLQGEELAAKAVYDAYKRPLLFLMSSYLPTKEDVLDAYQEAFAKLLESRDKIEKPEALQSYFNRIALSVALDMARKLHEESPLEEEEASSAEQVFLDDLLPYGLSKVEKMILGGRISAGMSWKEISIWLDIPISTAKAHYKKALESVRKELGK